MTEPSPSRNHNCKNEPSKAHGLFDRFITHGIAETILTPINQSHINTTYHLKHNTTIQKQQKTLTTPKKKTTKTTKNTYNTKEKNSTTHITHHITPENIPCTALSCVTTSDYTQCIYLIP